MYMCICVYIYKYTYTYTPARGPPGGAPGSRAGAPRAVNKVNSSMYVLVKRLYNCLIIYKLNN